MEVVIVSEITALLENKPGRLAKICSALAGEKIDLQAISVMEAEGPSVLRLVTSDLEATKKVLTGLGTEYKVAEAISAQIENRPGSLAKILEKLAAENINIDYAYVSAGPSQGKSIAIFRSANPKRALQVLNDAAARSAEKAGGRRPLHSR